MFETTYDAGEIGDGVGPFLAAGCVPDAEARTPGKTLYRAYRRWLPLKSRPLGYVQFVRKAKSYGLASCQTPYGRGLAGVAVRPSASA